MYVVQAAPHRAILEPDYFIKCIEVAEAKRDAEIERAEAGFADEEDKPRTEKAEMTEWELLQSLPDADYLMRTVLPVLYQGMRVMDLERPAAPLECLAVYLLKHQDQVKLPPKAFTHREEH